MYKEGQSFLEYVKERYGEEKVFQLLDNFWMYNNNFDKILEYTLGEKLDDIDEDWEYYLKQKYYPLLRSSHPPGIHSEQITEEGFNFSPAFYKDGEDEYVYFNANRNGYSSLYRMKINNLKNIEDEDPELLIEGERTVEFESFHLFQSSIDVSSDGVVAFVTKSGATDAVHFYSIKEREVTRKYQQDFLISISSPKFSSDGTMLVFNAVDRRGFSDIFLLDLKDNSLQRLTNDYYDDRDPSFGLTRKQVLFSSDRTSGPYEKKYNIFSINPDNNSISYVTYLNSNNYTPVLNNSKDKLLFTSDNDGVRNIWMLDITDSLYGNSANKVTSLLTSSFNPSFKSNNEILFTGFEKFSFNIYLHDLSRETDDSSRIVMSFDPTGDIWKAPEIVSIAEREKYTYDKQYTLDYAQSEVSTDPVFGTRGGAIFSLSDLLGDDKYFFLLYNTAETQSDLLKSFNIILQKLNLSERANYSYGVFHFSGRRYDIRESEEFFFERSFGGFMQLYFPLSKFQRIQTSVSIANSDKQVIEGFVERKALLLTNSISFVHDNSLWGPSGPLDGSRGMLLLGYTGDVKYSNVNYFTVIADYRHYLRMGLRTALALRGALFYNEGKEARRYFMGGSWDLRGWPRWSIRGEKMWLSSMEFRFPLIDQLAIKFPFVNLGFWGLRGALFFDAGSAWDLQYQNTLGSIGAGIRFNLFGVLVLRYDIGKKIENNFSTLQDNLFYQFFFGWDF